MYVTKRAEPYPVCKKVYMIKIDCISKELKDWNAS